MDLTDFYQGGYVDGTYGDRMRESLERILALPESASDNAGRVKRVLDFAKNRWKTDKVPDLLDVGSGLAVFPFRMREAGWQVTALDPDARAAKHARKNAKVCAIHADFLNWEPPEGSRFDVITMNKVLEHVENPVAMLERARQWIRPCGFVYVEVPNVAAAAAGQGREEFFIEHLHVFTLKSLSQSLRKAGWLQSKVSSIKEPSNKFTLFAFAK
jgi:2-polyprenyl-3-methyl-5-hydroxy-6-metoxy-1,4-benzoquinol methylase